MVAGRVARAGGQGTAPAESTGFLVRAAHRALVRALAARLAAHGLFPAQWSTLRALWAEDGCSQVVLAARMGVEKASLTPVLLSLEKAGHIRRQRSPADRRMTTVHLTPSGQALRPLLLPLAAEVNAAALRGLPPAEAERLHAALRRIVANLAPA